MALILLLEIIISNLYLRLLLDFFLVSVTTYEFAYEFAYEIASIILIKIEAKLIK